MNSDSTLHLPEKGDLEPFLTLTSFGGLNVDYAPYGLGLVFVFVAAWTPT